MKFYIGDLYKNPLRNSEFGHFTWRPKYFIVDSHIKLP